MSAGQSAFGNPWSVYEDQALVVLVHDMGPNWELVSDAINSTLQFKCIFRKPKECKERHKELMDMNDDDGVDSAEGSGPSQHYPSTLPGIPKGSARQLLQHLHGPIEEDTLKGHFEKIIRLGQLLHSRRSQKPKVNMIITDYCMPEMTGFDLLKCLEEGAEEFLLKPLHPSDVSRLRSHMNHLGSVSGYFVLDRENQCLHPNFFFSVASKAGS